MTWRFRKSFSPLPGVRITLTPRGVSTSVGVGSARLTSGSRGSTLTTRVPGTGVSFQRQLFLGEREEQSPPSPAPIAPIDPRSMEEIRSAGSSALESPGLAEFARLLIEARRERDAIGRELHQVRGRERQAVSRSRVGATGGYSENYGHNGSRPSRRRPSSSPRIVRNSRNRNN